MCLHLSGIGNPLNNYGKCNTFQFKMHAKHEIFKSRSEVCTISDAVKSSEQAHVMA